MRGGSPQIYKSSMNGLEPAARLLQSLTPVTLIRDLHDVLDAVQPRLELVELGHEVGYANDVRDVAGLGDHQLADRSLRLSPDHEGVDAKRISAEVPTHDPLELGEPLPFRRMARVWRPHYASQDLTPTEVLTEAVHRACHGLVPVLAVISVDVEETAIEDVVDSIGEFLGAEPERRSISIPHGIHSPPIGSCVQGVREGDVAYRSEKRDEGNGDGNVHRQAHCACDS